MQHLATPLVVGQECTHRNCGHTYYNVSLVSQTATRVIDTHAHINKYPCPFSVLLVKLNRHRYLYIKIYSKLTNVQHVRHCGPGWIDLQRLTIKVLSKTLNKRKTIKCRTIIKTKVTMTGKGDNEQARLHNSADIDSLSTLRFLKITMPRFLKCSTSNSCGQRTKEFGKSEIK